MKYRHDVSAGEMLNIGVMLFAPEVGQVGLMYSFKYSRLSETFAGFDGDAYRSVMGRLDIALGRVAKPMADNLFEVEARGKFMDAGAVLRDVWPDQGLGYFAGPVLRGVTGNLDRELKELYDRFVLSQQDKRDIQARFDDEDLWNDFRTVLTARGIAQVLKPKALGPAEVEFQHAYKNEKWHVIEAVSLDYANPSDMKQRALLTLGKAAALKDVEEFGSFTVIVGKPRRAESEKKLLDAMRLLAEMPVEHHIIDEDHKEAFASRLEAEMLAHGIPLGAPDS